MQIMIVFMLLLNVSLFPTMHACICAEPNPPTNLSALMTCDSQGHKIQIEWKVYSTDSKSAAQNALLYNIFCRLLLLSHFVQH